MFEVIRALEAAEDNGLVDVAELLGRAYHEAGRYRDAELAWLRVLDRTSQQSLRRSATECLVSLYRQLGAVHAQRELLAYLQALDGITLPATPAPRIQRTLNGRYITDNSGRGFRGWWRRSGPWRRFIAKMISGLAVPVGLADGLYWLFHTFP